MQNKIIGLKLKKLRTERALNQFELGKKLNVSRTAVGNWERGERSINITDLTAISQFFGVPLTYFTSDSVDDEPLTQSEGNVIIKVYKLNPTPKIRQIVLSLFLIAGSLLGVYFNYGNQRFITGLYFIFWAAVILLMIFNQYFSLKKYSVIMSFSPAKTPHFVISDKEEIKIDYYSYIFFTVFTSISMSLSLIIFTTYLNYDNIANAIVINTFVILILIGITYVDTLRLKPKPIFKYYPTNRYFSLLYYDILFYYTLTLSVIISGFMILYGAEGIPFALSLSSLLVMIGTTVIAYIIRFNRRVLFARYKITIK